MKIGILTHELGINYGGLLQNYALQQVLMLMGHDPITLNHKKSNPYTVPIKIGSLIKQILRKARGVKENLRVWTSSEEKAYIAQNITPFVDEKIVHTEPFLLSEIESHIPQDLDAIIVGSDQVWNPSYMKSIEHFFLSDFVNSDIIKIAYAASFGGNEWLCNERVTLNLECLAQKFNLITVREDSGVMLCKENLKIDATHVLDPTMLLTAEHYSSLSPRNRKHNDKSLMTYILDNSIPKRQIITRVADKLGLEVNSVMPKSTFRKEGPKGLDKCVFPSVETWIQGFEDAEFVVTDSFHGTVFAIIFNKPFITIINRQRGADRFFSLLRQFGLEDRLIDINDNYLDLIDKDIDYKRINSLLNIKREESLSLLKKGLSR